MAPIQFGAYPESNPNVADDVVIEDNELPFFAQGIIVDHVHGGAIRNNRLTRVGKVHSVDPRGRCGIDARPIQVTNSGGVVVEGNRIE